MTNDDNDKEEVVVILDSNITMAEDWFGNGDENKNDGEKEDSDYLGTTKFDVAKYIVEELILASTLSPSAITSKESLFRMQQQHQRQHHRRKSRNQIEVVSLIVLKTTQTSHHFYDDYKTDADADTDANNNNDSYKDFDCHKEFFNLTEYGIDDENEDHKSISQRLQSIVISSSNSRSTSVTSTSGGPCAIKKDKDKHSIKYGDFINGIVLATYILCRRAIKSVTTASTKIVLLTDARHKVLVNNSENEEGENEDNDDSRQLLVDIFKKLRAMNCRLEVVGMGFRQGMNTSDEDKSSEESDDEEEEEDDEDDNDNDDDDDDDDDEEEDLCDIQDKNEDLLRNLAHKLGGCVIKVKGGSHVGNNSTATSSSTSSNNDDYYDIRRALDHVLNLKSNSNKDINEILIDDDDDKNKCNTTICELDKLAGVSASASASVPARRRGIGEEEKEDYHLSPKTKKHKRSDFLSSYTHSNDYSGSNTKKNEDGADGDNTNSDTNNTTTTNDMTIQLINQFMSKKNPQQKPDTQQFDPEISIIEPSDIRTITNTTTDIGNSINLNDENEDGNNNQEDDEIQVMSSTTVNPNINYPHKRPDCGVYAFFATDIDGNTLQDRFCDNCYCVVCDVPAKDCTEWKDHFQEVYISTGDDTMDDEILMESPTTTARNYYAETVSATGSASYCRDLFRSTRPSGRERNNNNNYDTTTEAGESSKNTGVASTQSTSHRRSCSVVGANIILAKIREKKVIEYKAPYTLEHVARKFLVEISADAAAHLARENEDCLICQCPLIVKKADGVSQQSKKKKEQERAVTIPCGHNFHRRCILDSIKSNLGNKCPFKCDKKIPQGKCPSGSMSISRDTSRHCSGYENNPLSAGTIIILYHIPKSRQLKYHMNPSILQRGACRTCYLPDINQSNRLILRLQYAFSHGLCFTVGTSNQVLWTSIPHKTSMTVIFDSNYFEHCNQELDKLSVPQAEELPNGSNDNDVSDIYDNIRLPWEREGINIAHRRKFH